MRFEIFRRFGITGWKWYFRIRSAQNGQIVAQSEAYSRKIDAMSTAQSIRQQVGEAEVFEV